MPQVFQVLCCYNCEMFQVHQVKKSNKWQCRGCNAKQSLKKAFKIGTARECRFLVQDLNMHKSGFTEQNENLNNYEDIENALEEECRAPELLERIDIDKYPKKSADNYEFARATCSTADDKILPNTILEICSENPTVYKRNSHTENITEEDCCNKTENENTVIKDAEQYKSAISGEINLQISRKRPLDNSDVGSTSKIGLPTFKKNRGFQIILNAASKLS